MADAHDIQSWLNGDKLRSEKFREQYPLIALIVVLIFLYILTGYQSAKQQHQLTGCEVPLYDDKCTAHQYHASEPDYRCAETKRE